MCRSALKLLVLPLLAALFWALPAWSGDPETLLTLERCLEIALENNPDLAAEEASLRIAEAVVDERTAPLRPSLSLSSTTRQGEGKGSTSAGLTVNQLLSDGGRSRLALASAQLGRDETKETLIRRRQELVYDVKASYYDLLRARWDLTAAEETQDLYGRQLDQARAAYDVGLVPRSDVTAAQVDLGRARLDRTKASSALARSRSALERTLGADLGEGFSVAEVGSRTTSSVDADRAMERALALRPDLRARERALSRARLDLAYAAKGLNAQFSTFGGYDWSDGDDGQWQAGVSLAIPLVDGGLVAAKTAQARGALDRAQALETSLRQTVIFEVRQALLALDEARESLVTTELNLVQARENVDLAQGRYAVGVGSSLEVSQAAEAFSRSRRDHNDALYGHHLALASLEKATASPITEEIAEEAR